MTLTTRGPRWRRRYDAAGPVLDGVDEDHVGTRVGEPAPTLDGLVDPVRGQRVGTTDHDQIVAPRARTAARTLETASSRSITDFPERCPHRFGKTWSSTWSAAAPALM